MPLLLSATIMRFRTPLTAAYWRSASTAARSKTSLLRAAAFSKAVTIARSAPVAATRWQDAKLGQAVLVALSPRLSTWLGSRDTPSSYDGGWAAIAALLVKAGDSIMSR